jgi:hypothetical protein
VVMAMQANKFTKNPFFVLDILFFFFVVGDCLFVFR